MNVRETHTYFRLLARQREANALVRVHAALTLEIDGDTRALIANANDASEGIFTQPLVVPAHVGALARMFAEITSALRWSIVLHTHAWCS